MNNIAYSTTTTLPRGWKRVAPWIAAAALLVAGASVGLLPTRAFADSSVPAATFNWSVQLVTTDSTVSMAGNSADLPDAIQLAESGESFTVDQRMYLESVLAQEAQQENASLVAASVPPASTPAPVFSSDDSGSNE